MTFQNNGSNCVIRESDDLRAYHELLTHGRLHPRHLPASAFGPASWRSSPAFVSAVEHEERRVCQNQRSHTQRSHLHRQGLHCLCPTSASFSCRIMSLSISSGSGPFLNRRIKKKKTSYHHAMSQKDELNISAELVFLDKKVQKSG